MDPPPLQSNDARSHSFFDDNGSGHLWMNRAKVGVSAGRTGGDRKFVASIEGGRLLKLLSDADHRVRLVVTLDPGDSLSGLDRQDRRTKREVFDLNCVSPVTDGRTTRCVVSPSGETKIENNQGG